MHHRMTTAVVTAALFICSSLPAQRQPASGNGTDLSPFTDILSHGSRSFTEGNSVLHAGALMATFLIITTDVDYRVHRYFNERPELDPLTVPAVWLGYTVPLLLGGGYYASGLMNHDDEAVAAGCAVLQASLISQAYVSVLKAVTGRPHPDPKTFPDMKEASRLFRFGFLRGGLHYGWPSGHLAVNTAAVTSLMAFYPNNSGIMIAGSFYLAYLMAGVSAHEGGTMHWFSDIAAGTLMGAAIGPTVGRAFRKLHERGSGSSGEVGSVLSPIVSPSFTGLSLHIQF